MCSIIMLVLSIIVAAIDFQQMSLKKLKLLQSQLKSSPTVYPTKPKCVEQIHPVTGQVLRVYPSVTAAANCMGIAKSSINSCCNGKVQTCGRFKWRFYDGPPLDCKYYIIISMQYNAIYINIIILLLILV